jgi:hypothetical protein
VSDNTKLNVGGNENGNPNLGILNGSAGIDNDGNVNPQISGIGGVEGNVI